MPSGISPSAYATELVHCAFVGSAPRSAADLPVTTDACFCLVDWSAEALRASKRPADALDVAQVLTHVDLGVDCGGDLEEGAHPPTCPVVAATGLAEQVAVAGSHEVVDEALISFLRADPGGNAVVLAKVTANLLRLVDGPQVQGTLRAAGLRRR